MFSKSQIKLITSLAQKKYREKHRLFLAEGKKTIQELLDSSLSLHSLYTTEDLFEADTENTFFINDAELAKISRLTTPQTALAVFRYPEVSKMGFSGLILALDGVRDPGNLGTIIRLCDWFGIEQLVCSKDTVDCFNPKVVQATMGSIARVSVVYDDLNGYLEEAIKSNFPVYGAFMGGANVYEQKLSSEGILVLGNEANGIRPQTEAQINKRLNIPQFGASKETESLNVATAAAVLLSEFRRSIFTGK